MLASLRHTLSGKGRPRPLSYTSPSVCAFARLLVGLTGWGMDHGFKRNSSNESTFRALVSGALLALPEEESSPRSLQVAYTHPHIWSVRCRGQGQSDFDMYVGLCGDL